MLDDKIHNYVCFDNSDTCDPDNLYRIIGVIDNKIELIKNDFVSQSQLGIDASKMHTAFSYLYMGQLPKVDTYSDHDEILDALNNNYLKTFSNTLMLDRKWKNSSISDCHDDIVIFNLLDNMSYKYVHLNYILNKTSDELMTDNWLFIGTDWMLSSSIGALENNVCESGDICLATAAIRPIFSLNKKVAYKSGDGSKTNPIRINTDKLSYFTLLGNKYVFEKEMTWADYFNSDFLQLRGYTGKMYVDGNKIWDGMNILLYDDYSTRVLLTDKIIPEEEYVAYDP